MILSEILNRKSKMHIDGEYYIKTCDVLDILNTYIKENSCATCTHKGYDCDNDFWINCDKYIGEDKQC